MTEYTTLGNLISPAKVIRCGNGSYPVLSMTMHDGIVLQSDRFKKSLASADQSDYKVVKYGQLVVGFPIDEGVLYIQKATDEGIMSPAYNVWDVDTLKVEADYLELCLHSPQAMQYYCDKLRGSTARRRSIPTAELLALPIRLPTLEEQREKLKMMAKMNALIKDREQQLDLADQLVKSRFIEMFGDYDLAHPESDWKPIAEIGKVVGGSTPKTNVNEYWDGEYRWITPAELEADSGYIYDSVRKLTKAGVNSCSLQEMPIHTVILTSRAPIGKVAIAGATFYCNQGFKNIICKDEIVPRYLYTLLLLNTEYLNSLGRGATFKEISKSIVENIRIPVPSLENQTQFTTFVEQIDKSKYHGEITCEMEVAA